VGEGTRVGFGDAGPGHAESLVQGASLGVPFSDSGRFGMKNEFSG